MLQISYKFGVLPRGIATRDIQRKRRNERKRRRKRGETGLYQTLRIGQEELESNRITIWILYHSTHKSAEAVFAHKTDFNEIWKLNREFILFNCRPPSIFVWAAVSVYGVIVTTYDEGLLCSCKATLPWMSKLTCVFSSNCLRIYQKHASVIFPVQRSTNLGQ